MSITAFPTTPPSTSDPVNFNARADALLGHLPTFVSEANALATEVEGYKNSAASSAAAAASAGGYRDQALTYRNEAQGFRNEAETFKNQAQTYGGSAVTSVNGVSGPGAITIPMGGFNTVILSGTGWGVANGERMVMTNASASTISLPASPSDGAMCAILVANGRTDNVVDPGAKLINGVGGAQTINRINASLVFLYVNSTLQWRII